MQAEFNLFLASFVSLFAIVDPIVAAPVFVSITAHDDERKKRRQANAAALYTLAILLGFFAAGTFILKFFGISLEGIRIAGGLMVMNAAKGMLEEKKKLNQAEYDESVEKEDVAFSPIAMPMLSGPGSIAVIIGMSAAARGMGDYVAICAAIVAVTIVSWIVLRLAPRIVRGMGPTVMNAMTKMMGFLVLCIGVQFILDGALSLAAARFAK